MWAMCPLLMWGAWGIVQVRQLVAPICGAARDVGSVSGATARVALARPRAPANSTHTTTAKRRVILTTQSTKRRADPARSYTYALPMLILSTPMLTGHFTTYPPPYHAASWINAPSPYSQLGSIPD